MPGRLELSSFGTSLFSRRRRFYEAAFASSFFLILIARLDPLVGADFPARDAVGTNTDA